MTTEIVARFVDGRLLVREENYIGSHYHSGGIPFRIGQLRQVESVLSLEAQLSGYPAYKFGTSLKECTISGNTIFPILRRIDLLGLGYSGVAASGYPINVEASGVIATNIPYMGQITSNLTSGKINIVANVIGY